MLWMISILGLDLRIDNFDRGSLPNPHPDTLDPRFLESSNSLGLPPIPDKWIGENQKSFRRMMIGKIPSQFSQGLPSGTERLIPFRGAWKKGPPND